MKHDWNIVITVDFKIEQVQLMPHYIQSRQQVKRHYSNYKVSGEFQTLTNT